MENPRVGGVAPRLWCVELVPKRRRLSRNDRAKVFEMAKGMPSKPLEALAWMVRVVDGFSDQRVPVFARDRRRLVVFRVKKRAAERAREETDERWTGKVREVRVR